MRPIHSFKDLTSHLSETGRRFRLSIVCGSDESTYGAAMKAVRAGFAEAIFVGDCKAIRTRFKEDETDRTLANYVDFVEAESHEEAARLGVLLIKEGHADILMKGLLHTATLLRAVLNKQEGVLPPGRVLTHIAMAEIPSYERLLFFTDAAVIPYPTDEQRAAQIGYMADLLHAFGIDEPRISLIHCAETASEKFPHTLGYADLCRRAAEGEWGRLLLDGPLDLRTSCDPVGLRLKGINSCLEGRADGLIVPDIEVGNVLYKTLPLFAGANIAGTLRGTTAPVVLPSRGDDLEGKYHSLALAVMACGL